jgi:hypothetical protein
MTDDDTIDDVAVEHALALAAFYDREPLDVAAENRAHRLDAHRCCWCGDIVAQGDRLACSAHRRRLDAEPAPWDEREEALPPHDDETARQWERDHPDGHISAEEHEAMDRYGAESCREEGCR